MVNKIIKKFVLLVLSLMFAFSGLSVSVTRATQDVHDHSWSYVGDVGINEQPFYRCSICGMETTTKPASYNEILEEVLYKVEGYNRTNICFLLRNVFKGGSYLEGHTSLYIREDSEIIPDSEFILADTELPNIVEGEVMPAGTSFSGSDFILEDGTTRVLSFVTYEDSDVVIATWNLSGFSQLLYGNNYETISFALSKSGGLRPITYHCVNEKTEMTPSEKASRQERAETSNLRAKGVENAVLLTWKKVDVADGYLIYGYKNGKYGYVGMTKGTSYKDTKALTKDYNYYWVFSYSYFYEFTIVGKCKSYVYSRALLPAPTGLKASSVKGGVKLSWNASSGAEGYLIYGIVDGRPYGYVGMTTKGTTFTDIKASSKEYNYYWVIPYYKDANGKIVVGQTGKYTYGRALPGNRYY